MKVAIFGNKSETVALLRSLSLSCDHELTAAFLTAPKRLSGSISGASNDIETAVIDSGMDFIEVDDYSLAPDVLAETFSNKNFDIGLSDGWQRLIPVRILESLRHGVYGWHGSPFEIPDGRGRSPMNWAIRLCANQVYHYLFRLEEGADTGSIFEHLTLNIGPETYIGDLVRMAHAHVLSSALRLLDEIQTSSLELRSQAKYSGLFLPKLSPADSLIDPAAMTVNQAAKIVRASSRPFPGAVLEAAQDREGYRVWSADVSSDTPSKSTGTSRIERGQLIVCCRDGELASGDFETLPRA